MKIMLNFKNPIDISLFSDRDKLKVQLWGPFLSEENLNPIREEDREQIKVIPSQLKDDLASLSILQLVDKDVIVASTIAAVAAN